MCICWWMNCVNIRMYGARIISFMWLSSEVGCRLNGDLAQIDDDDGIVLFLHIHFPILLLLPFAFTLFTTLSSSPPPSPPPSSLNPVCICWYLWQVGGCRVRRHVSALKPEKMEGLSSVVAPWLSTERRCRWNVRPFILVYKSKHFYMKASVEHWRNNVDREEPRTRTWGDGNRRSFPACVSVTCHLWTDLTITWTISEKDGR